MGQKFSIVGCLLLLLCGCGPQAYRPHLAPLKIQALAQPDFTSFCRKQRRQGDGPGLTLQLMLERLKTEDCSLAGERLAKLNKLDLHASELSDLRPLAYASALAELSISYSKVKDIKPLADIPTLRRLYADGLSLQNEDLASLAQLPELQELSLVRTSITDLSALREKDSLEVLRLGEQSLDWASLEGLGVRELFLFRMPSVGLNIIGKLPRLQALSIEQSPLPEEQLASLAKLSALQSLNLTGTQIRSLDFVSGMKQLTKLYVSDTQVADLKPLRALKDLQVLALGRTAVEDLEPLAGLHRLSHLYLYQTRVSQITALSSLKKLQLLSLSQTLVRDIKPLGLLPDLEALYLISSYIPDKSVLLGLPKLKLLYAEDQGIDEDLFKRMQRAKPELQIFTHPMAPGDR